MPRPFLPLGILLGVLTIDDPIIYTSLQPTCIKKSYRHSTEYDNHNEGVFSLSDILLIMTNPFQTVKQTKLPNESISLIKFDHLLFAPRSGKGQYFPLN